jgi:hypothetical protein
MSQSGDSHDPYIPTPEEVLARRATAAKTPAGNVIARIVRWLRPGVGETKKVMAPARSNPGAATKGTQSPDPVEARERSVTLPAAMVPEQDKRLFVDERRSLSGPAEVHNAVPRRSVKISAEASRRRGEAIRRPKSL